MYIIPIVEIGDSLGIIFPPKVVERLQLEVGDDFLMTDGAGRSINLAFQKKERDESGDSSAA